MSISVMQLDSLHANAHACAYIISKCVQEERLFHAYKPTKMGYNYLTFNPSKSKSHGIFKKETPCSSPYFTLNGSRLEIVNTVKYLGITISLDLSWSKHINIINSKAQKLVGLLFRQFYRWADMDIIRELASFGISKPCMGSVSTEGPTNSWKICLYNMWNGGI